MSTLADFHGTLPVLASPTLFFFSWFAFGFVRKRRAVLREERVAGSLFLLIGEGTAGYLACGAELLADREERSNVFLVIWNVLQIGELLLLWSGSVAKRKKWPKRVGVFNFVFYLPLIHECLKSVYYLTWNNTGMVIM